MTPENEQRWILILGGVLAVEVTWLFINLLIYFTL